MKFDKYAPTENLKEYIKYYVVSENAIETEYKVFPPTGLVIGFQYRGQLSSIQDQTAHKMNPAGISGMADGFKVFKNTADTGTLLVYFTETGFTHFTSTPAHEFFDLSPSLNEIFDPGKVSEVQEKLSAADTDLKRIKIVEGFLLSLLTDIKKDPLIVEAVNQIYLSKGTIRAKELHEKLWISQSPFEKRFRKWVGASPKKFCSIVRFHATLENLSKTKSVAEICYEHRFFDQAHFIKEFKYFTGDTPEHFKRNL